MTVIYAISDTHGYLPDIPECDLLLIAGDITPTFSHEDTIQGLWLSGNFANWLDDVPAKEVVVVAGNHDFYFEGCDQTQAQLMLGCHYLCDSGIELFGLKIWGSPWQPIFYNWAFNLDEDGLNEKWTLIPEDTDVLITHGPPYGYGDSTYRGEYVGSHTLREHVDHRVRPKLHVYGHVHEGGGLFETDYGVSANVAYVDYQYQPKNEPFRFELDNVS